MVKEEREGHTDQGQECRDGARPVDAETVVHGRGEKGEDRTEETADDRVGGQDAGSVYSITVD